MRRSIVSIALVACLLAFSSLATGKETEQVANQIISTEKSALTSWLNGDPKPYLELYDPEITYFDPFLSKRLDGRQAIQEYVDKIKGNAQPGRLRFEMIDPRVQMHGDIAVLTFNLSEYRKEAAEPFYRTCFEMECD